MGGNKNSEFTVEKACTKVMIEGCTNCTIRLNAAVNTETVEIWNSDDTTLLINTRVKTLQADLCKNLTSTFAEKSFFTQIIWAGMENYKIAIGDESLDTGIETIDREEVPDFKERFDQFIIRHVKGKLIQELIVRCPEGEERQALRGACSTDAQQPIARYWRQARSTVQEGNQEGRTQRALPLWQWQEVQEVL